MNDDATHIWWPDGTLIPLTDIDGIAAKGEVGGHRVKQTEVNGRVMTVMAEAVAVAEGAPAAPAAPAEMMPAADPAAV